MPPISNFFGFLSCYSFTPFLEEPLVLQNQSFSAELQQEVRFEQAGDMEEVKETEPKEEAKFDEQDDEVEESKYTLSYSISEYWQGIIEQEVQTARDKLKHDEKTCNPQQLRELFNLAFKSDCHHTQCTLGYMYATGSGVQQNWKLAVNFYRQAATSCDPLAQHSLGLIHFYDFGSGEKDFNKSGFWFAKARDRAYPPTLNSLAVHLSSAVGKICLCGPLGLNIWDRNQVDQTILDLYRQAASLGFADSQFRLGYIYERGDMVDKDVIQAVELYRRAAAQGHRIAQHKLGWFYECGLHGVEKNYGEALKWFQLSAAQNYSWAYRRLSFMYLEGKGVERDQESADRFLELEKKGTSGTLEFCQLPRPSNFNPDAL